MNLGEHLLSGLRDEGRVPDPIDIYETRFQNLSDEVQNRNDRERNDSISGATDNVIAENRIYKRPILPSDELPEQSLANEARLATDWSGPMTCWKHVKVIFPGDTTRVCSANVDDFDTVLNIIQSDKLIGMLCYDDLSASLTSFGVLCEIFEAMESGIVGKDWQRLSFKVRGLRRFRILEMPSIDTYYPRGRDIMHCKIRILPEILSLDCLRKYKLPSLQNRRLNTIHALVSPWPSFLYQVFDAEYLLNHFKTYFNVDRIDGVPSDLVQFSFWLMSHVYCLSHTDRVAILPLDNVLLRLHTVAEHLRKGIR